MECNNILVGGTWVPSEAEARIEAINPATEEVVARIPDGTSGDVDRATAAAVASFERWSQSSLDERKAVLNRLADLIDRDREPLLRNMVAESGLPITPAGRSQVDGASDELRLMAEVVDQIDWATHYGSSRVVRQAAGVTGAITAWNAPLRSIISKAGAAIAAGCTVVVKPSEVTPLSAIALADLFGEAGAPDGVFNLVLGRGPVIGEAIASHPDIEVVSLTGSVRAGQRVMELASRMVKRVHLELGGKSANVVLRDADVERAVQVGIEDAFRNTGQACGALTRVVVPRPSLAKAEAAAVAKVESYVVGDPMDPATTIGPVATASQFRRVRDYIDIGQAEGARLLVGGSDRPKGLNRGYYVNPTVFTGDNFMRIAREEIFGPVVVIIPYEDETEALQIANDCDYGLAGAVWAADTDRARAFAQRMRAGRIRVNGTAISKYAPHGGFKLSGIGREWGRYGIEEFLEYQSIHG
ncbi:aldehyde dehydrogenase family protein [Paracoccus denitrificans]|jgi:acyl-CoA reductase-like NAD-dependent aldehyde dehydrogenase|uniref:aldehyde dehydrogenase (NAD(+)) n=1 Tax=Paracoccus denitrificans (strain Pd 1222) TaxID=318586 RepID=A1B745_PARDP|nr:aldehyde dehydrogenase family protein [Paracoccus denitrificans]ABL71339.1 aldehyde dehydrogenase [Paracoccus denitrificans PD1222]MBB4629961.1 acyl-CoA reductase-like NAD-dependent aldehyde dehydrogenase [Paracoccus denitrificans]MCU7431310.1 aldehyde dehydrogenase family protein [Paracoccus denitrificans]QAR27967.1 aldehyde dehydrogenase family protein [Paracoccus denitrificans]UPV97683.1 aldehyde dehydrogenase family protein [Paracoccus denitrificans]